MSNWRLFERHPLLRTDGINELSNVITGMGTGSHDPLAGLRLSQTGYFYQEILDSFYEQFNLIRKLCDTIPDQMTYRWGTLTLGGKDSDPEVISKVETYLKSLQVLEIINQSVSARKAFNLAMKYANRSGNGAIVILADDGQDDPSQPLNEKNLKTIRGLFVLDRWSIQPLLSNLFFEEIQHYRITQHYAGSQRFEKKGLYSADQYQRIHRSRVLWFRGNELPQRSLIRNDGCDHSVIQGVLSSFTRYQTGMQGAGRMIQDYEVFYHKIEGLLEKLDSGDPACVQTFMKRLQLMQQSKSLYRGYVLDQNKEEIGNLTRQGVSGYGELLDKFVDDLLANTPLQPMELFGKYPKGMADTGKVEQQQANDRTEAFQADKFDDNLQYLLRLVFLAKDGPTNGKIPEDWGWQWHSLHPTTPVEEAELRHLTAQTDDINLRNNVYRDEDAMRSHYGKEKFDPNITVDIEEWEAAQKKREEQAAQEQQQLGGGGFPEDQQAEEGEAGEQQPAQDEELQQLLAELEKEAPSEPEERLNSIRTDDATRAQRWIEWKGLRIGLQYLPFQKRHGRVLPVGYGFIAGTKGEDGMAVDAYVHPDLSGDHCFRIKQLTEAGDLDEYKYMLGFRSQTAARECYQAVMPSSFYGGIEAVPVASLRSQTATPTRTRTDSRANRITVPLAAQKTARGAVKANMDGRKKGVRSQDVDRARQMQGGSVTFDELTAIAATGAQLIPQVRRDAQRVKGGRCDRAQCIGLNRIQCYGGVEGVKWAVDALKNGQPKPKARQNESPVEPRVIIDGTSNTKGKECGKSHIAQTKTCHIGMSLADRIVLAPGVSSEISNSIVGLENIQTEGINERIQKVGDILTRNKIIVANHNTSPMFVAKQEKGLINKVVSFIMHKMVNEENKRNEGTPNIMLGYTTTTKSGNENIIVVLPKDKNGTRANHSPLTEVEIDRAFSGRHKKGVDNGNPKHWSVLSAVKNVKSDHVYNEVVSAKLTLIHELGHAVDSKKGFSSKLPQDYKAITQYGAVNKEEAVAEAFSLWMLSPNALKKVSPSFYEIIHQGVNSD